ncbi:hypothetical protein [Scytonema sp. PCC 10023]
MPLGLPVPENWIWKPKEHTQVREITSALAPSLLLPNISYDDQ